MKTILIAVLAIVCLTYGRPQERGPQAKILKSHSENTLNGYEFSFETSDPIHREEKGELREDSQKNASMVVEGNFDWTDETGKKYSVTFVADENGYRPIVRIGE